jgi:hypothetical protein
MTAQAPEVLLLDGRRCAMCTNPLEDYFKLTGIRSPFSCTCSAVRRGYIGIWDVRDQRLYLLGLQGSTFKGAELNLGSFFPGHPGRVFAYWYSGTVRLPEGRRLKYAHGGYASIYERDRLLRFDKGVLVDVSLRCNGDAGEIQEKGPE